VNFIASLFIGMLTGVLAGACSGYVTSMTYQWHQLSNREGAGGYAVIFMAMFGFVAGAAVGTAIAYFIGATEVSGWFKGLGASFATVLVLTGAALGYSYVTMERPPLLDGERLSIEVQVKGAPGVDLRPVGERRCSIQMLAIKLSWFSRGGEARYLTSSSMDPQSSEAPASDQPTVLSARMSLDTDEKRLLCFSVTGIPDQSFYPFIAENPLAKDLEWTEWKTATFGKLETLPVEQQLQVRVRVRKASDTSVVAP
jgi:hypothetical protein